MSLVGEKSKTLMWTQFFWCFMCVCLRESEILNKTTVNSVYSYTTVIVKAKDFLCVHYIQGLSCPRTNEKIVFNLLVNSLSCLNVKCTWVVLQNCTTRIVSMLRGWSEAYTRVILQNCVPVFWHDENSVIMLWNKGLVFSK